MTRNDFVNIFDLLYDAINANNKKDLVDYIKNFREEGVETDR